MCVSRTSSTWAWVCCNRRWAAICCGVRGPPTTPSSLGSPAGAGASPPSGADLQEYRRFNIWVKCAVIDLIGLKPELNIGLSLSILSVALWAYSITTSVGIGN